MPKDDVTVQKMGWGMGVGGHGDRSCKGSLNMGDSSSPGEGMQHEEELLGGKDRKGLGDMIPTR